MTDPVLAAKAWSTNAHLIEDVARLGYLRAEWLTIDPTFENGIWWKRWRPDVLVTHNRDEDGSDFRDLPYADGHFDAAAYDPPYVPQGGRETSSLMHKHERYGREDGPASPAESQSLIHAGLTEMARIVRPDGIVLLKCQDYIWSGRFWPGTYLAQCHAETLGLACIDRFEHISGVRPQPGRSTCGRCGLALMLRSDRRWGDLNRSGRDPFDCDGGPHVPDGEATQVHARRNLSTLFIFQKG